MLLLARPIRSALTLIELIVVLSILAVLMGLLLSAVQRLRAIAIRTSCQNNLRQIGLALHQYHLTHHHFPPGCSYRNGLDPHPHMSWMTRLLPFLDQETLWQQSQRAFSQRPFFQDSPHWPILGHPLAVYSCPADPRAAVPLTVGSFQVASTSYLGVAGRDFRSADGLLYLDSRVRLADISDGSSTTLIVGERPPSADRNLGWWYAGWGQSKDGSTDLHLGVRERNVHPRYAACDPGPHHFRPGRLTDNCDLFHFWSLHSGGANFLLADGAVHFVPYSADPLLPSLASRNASDSTAPP